MGKVIVLIFVMKLESGGQTKRRGGVQAWAGKHLFVLIFFRSFLYQDKKEQGKKVWCSLVADEVSMQVKTQNIWGKFTESYQKTCWWRTPTRARAYALLKSGCHRGQVQVSKGFWIFYESRDPAIAKYNPTNTNLNEFLIHQNSNADLQTCQRISGCHFLSL